MIAAMIDCVVIVLELLQSWEIVEEISVGTFVGNSSADSGSAPIFATKKNASPTSRHALRTFSYLRFSLRSNVYWTHSHSISRSPCYFSQRTWWDFARYNQLVETDWLTNLQNSKQNCRYLRLSKHTYKCLEARQFAFYFVAFFYFLLWIGFNCENVLWAEMEYFTIFCCFFLYLFVWIFIGNHEEKIVHKKIQVPIFRNVVSVPSNRILHKLGFLHVF